MNKIILIFLVAVIFLGAGLGLGYLFFFKQIPADQKCIIDENNNFTAGWQAAKQRLIDLGIVQPIGSDVAIKEVRGEIMKIEGNKLGIDIIPFELLTDPRLDQRLVIIDENTEILKTAEKENSLYEKEMDEYRVLIGKDKYDDNDPDLPLPPSRYEKVKVGLDGLKIGEIIKIEAREDIKDKKEFIAERITL